MTETDLTEALRFLKGLADETRLKLLGILANGERSVEELATLLQVKAPTVSHHLAVLKELGLVTMERQGNVHLYRFEPETLRRLGREVLSPDAVASLATPAESSAWEEKVLRDWVEPDGRLKDIPSRHKKRIVILEWLLREFEPGVRYPESRVNEMLKRHHPDCATLRRELVDRGYLRRENGIYWRVDEGATGDVAGGAGDAGERAEA